MRNFFSRDRARLCVCMRGEREKRKSELIIKIVRDRVSEQVSVCVQRERERTFVCFCEERERDIKLCRGRD